MGYQEALEAAGARVLDFKRFGSYQGDWWAKVSKNGEEFFVTGSYGSCSGCDAFEAEFGYRNSDFCEEHYGKHDSSCAECIGRKLDYDIRLTAMGNNYLDVPMTRAQAIIKASADFAWDGEVPGMVEWIKSC